MNIDTKQDDECSNVYAGTAAEADDSRWRLARGTWTQPSSISVDSRNLGSREIASPRSKTWVPFSPSRIMKEP